MAQPVRESIWRQGDVVVDDVVTVLSDEPEELVARRGVQKEWRDSERDGDDPAAIVANVGARVQVVGGSLAHRVVGLDLLFSAELWKEGWKWE